MEEKCSEVRLLGSEEWSGVEGKGGDDRSSPHSCFKMIS